MFLDIQNPQFLKFLIWLNQVNDYLLAKASKRMKNK